MRFAKTGPPIQYFVCIKLLDGGRGPLQGGFRPWFGTPTAAGLPAARRIQVASQYRRARNFGLTEGWVPEVGSIVWYASLLFCNARSKLVGMSGFCKGDLPDGVSGLTEFPEAE